MKVKEQSPLRVLFVGSTEGNSTSVYYFINFLRLGHSVYPYDPAPFHAKNWREKVAIRVTKQPPPRNLERAHDELVELCRANSFDLVFVMAQNFLGRETLEAMRTASRVGLTLAYHSHDNNFSPGVLAPPDFSQTLRAYDVVFTTKSQNVERYRNLGQANSHFLPSAFEPSVHHPITPEYSVFTQKFEVSFVGTYDHSRDPLLEAVGWHRLHVWGDHWKRSPHFSRHKEQIHPRAIYFYEYSDVLSQSLCSLGLLRAEAEDRHTQRTFEIPACATLQVAPRNEEILSFFRENKEIVCFDTSEELKEKLDYYLSKPSQLSKVSKAGYARCLGDEHTYADRVRAIIRLAKAKAALKLVG